MLTHILKFHAALICIALISASCGTTQLASKQGENLYTEVFPVKGRQGILIKQKLSFGDYATEKVDRSWTKGTSWTIGSLKRTLEVPEATNVISYDHIKRKQTLRFAAVNPAGETADVYAATQVNAREISIGEGNGWGSFNIDFGWFKNRNSINLYYVQIYLNGEFQPWQLILDNETSQRQPGKYVGYLVGANGRYYQLKPAQYIAGKNGDSKKILMGSVGFEILDENGNSVAAVSTIDNGQVYFTRILQPGERFLIENLCAAILLQEQI